MDRGSCTGKESPTMSGSVYDTRAVEKTRNIHRAWVFCAACLRIEAMGTGRFCPPNVRSSHSTVRWNADCVLLRMRFSQQSDGSTNKNCTVLGWRGRGLGPSHRVHQSGWDHARGSGGVQVLWFALFSGPPALNGTVPMGLYDNMVARLDWCQLPCPLRKSCLD